MARTRLMYNTCALLFATKVSADGQSCNGEEYAWPTKSLCFGKVGMPKRYNCMWRTMEELSEAGRACADIAIDCDSSLICSAMLEYSCSGPLPCKGTEQSRLKAAMCLRQQCPAEAKVADDMATGTVGTKCPVTGYAPKAPATSQTLWYGSRLNEARTLVSRHATHFPLLVCVAIAALAMALVIVITVAFPGTPSARRVHAGDQPMKNIASMEAGEEQSAERCRYAHGESELQELMQQLAPDEQAPQEKNLEPAPQDLKNFEPLPQDEDLCSVQTGDDFSEPSSFERFVTPASTSVWSYLSSDFEMAQGGYRAYATPGKDSNNEMQLRGRAGQEQEDVYFDEERPSTHRPVAALLTSNWDLNSDSFIGKVSNDAACITHAATGLACSVKGTFLHFHTETQRYDAKRQLRSSSAGP